MTAIFQTFPRRLKHFCSALALLAAFTATTHAQQTDDKKEDAQNTPEKVEQREAKYYVRADVDRLDRIYRAGEPLYVSAICETDAYLYVLYKQADGKTFMVYPNSKQPKNFVKAKQKVQIPAGDDQFRWKIGEPFGKETILVVATKEPIKDLEDPTLREKLFNKVSTEQSTNAAVAMKAIDPDKLAMDKVEITTKPMGESVVARGTRRVGVFFGVKEYQFHDEALAASLADGGKKFEANMPCAANNVNVLSRLMKSMGKLDEVKTYISQDANKANLKDAITKWLPSVTRPGDTVFIYWSSHGGQLDDDDGDEADKKDEWLLVHDYVDLGILGELVKQREAGKLAPKLNARVDELLQIAKQAGEPVKAHNALIRHTAVSDDLFGHWLQSLAGRQVVVMLDTCHSGGFSVGEKSLGAAPSATGGFDFLDGEVGRLKDLGQQEAVLVSACSASASCYIFRAPDALIEHWKSEIKGDPNFDERVLENMFVFTYQLAEALATMPPPSDLRAIVDRCNEGMRGYFPKVNEYFEMKKDSVRLIPHEAILYDKFLTKPVIMKP
jgi:hypothetical protein